MHLRTLIIGYGNPSRRDDGVALHVINALRAQWSQPLLPDWDDGLDGLGSEHDTIFLQQLMPELVATIADYDLVIFVDAALPDTAPALELQPVAATYRPASVSHHLTPPTLLALAQQLYGSAPQGYLLSLQGHDLNFGDQLSPATAALIPQAVQQINDLIRRQG
jgi:hydrogenase maturation protease